MRHKRQTIMRTLVILSICLFLSNKEFSQNNSIKTFTLIVKGNCEECKERIENASDIKGVKFSKWNATTKILSVTYNSEKVKVEQIKQAILSSGHDLDSLAAPLTSYNKLPACCKYRDKKCEK